MRARAGFGPVTKYSFVLWAGQQDRLQAKCLTVHPKMFPTPAPSLAAAYSSLVHVNASWAVEESGWEVRQVFANLSVNTRYLFSVWLSTQQKIEPKKSDVYARITTPMGLYYCSLCATLQSVPAVNTNPPAQCISGQLVRCADNAVIPAGKVDPNIDAGSLTFRIVVHDASVTKGFRAALKLTASTALSTDDTTPTAAPTPYTSYYSLDRVPVNVTAIWLFCILFFVGLCAWRVMRRHRLNVAMMGAGSAGGRYGADDDGFDEIVLRHRQIALSPMQQHPQHPQQQQQQPHLQQQARLTPLESIPSAQVRVLSAQEAAQAEADDDAPRAVAAPVAAAPARGEYRI